MLFLQSVLLWAAGTSAFSVQSFLNPQAQSSNVQLPQSKPELLPLDTDHLQALINTKQLQAHAESFYNISLSSLQEFGNPTRVIGSQGHYQTLNYILSILNKYHWYYDIEVQPFHTIISKINSCNLTIDNAEPTTFTGLDLTPAGKVDKGKLFAIPNGGCNENDYLKLVKTIESNPEVDYVALIQRGSCVFGDKSIFAGKYGAKGVLIYDNEESKEIFHGTLGEPKGNEVPTIAITKKTGDFYLEKLNGNYSIDVSLFVDSYVKNVKTSNIIATTKLGDSNNIVMAGGHSDSVPAGPGINDDGTGSISLLVLAELLTNFKPNNAIRLAWWAAEEEGLIGSTYYVDQLSPEESKPIRLFLDYDMMASPNYAYQVYDGNNVNNPKGSEEIKNLYIDWYTQQGLNYTLVPFDGRSDYAAFIENNIAGGGIATGAEGIKTEEEVEKFGGKANEWYDQCYHQLCDDLTNLDYDAWLVNTKLIGHSLATYGDSLGGFPAKEEVTKVESVSANELPQFQYKGEYLLY